ncbi:hypothetical protein A0H81_11888 [Grifola frondosa]|uniref:CLASP N-terminal domain-containing protein n=1 Tax=Grifola frondosa TaxID=5627 RepID=A0A1C7LTS8_GRIFR|nr:hypothetical protein A0H81_11888 [Grifola frondosa]
MAPKVCPNIIECESLLELERTLIIVQERLSLPESEETWDSIAHAIIHLAALSKGNAVFVTRARTCITTIIEHTHSPTILSYLADAVKDKSASLRLAAADGVLACLNSFNPPDLEKEQRAREVEDIIRAIATDASADVRKAARRIFEAYKVLLPTRVESFTEPLTPTIKKYLDITPKVVPATKQPASRPTSSQSLHSVPVAARSKPLHPPKKVAPARMQRSAPSSSQSTSLRNGPSRATCAPSSRPQASSSVHVDITQSDRPFGGPLRVSKTQSTLQSGVEKAPSTRAGPIRPVMVMGTKTAAGEDLADSKGRVVGGARRVLLVAPPVEPSGPKDESEKTRADGADHLTRVRTISVSRSEGALSQSRSTTGLSRPKMAEKRIAGKDMKPAWGRGASSKLGAVSKPDFHKKIIPPKDHIPEEPPVAVQEVDTIAAVIPPPQP